MGIVDNIKDAAKLAQQIDNMPLYRQILDLQAEAMDLTQQLRDKDEQIRQLEESLSFKSSLAKKDLAYFTVDDSGNITDGPFCTKCFDVDHTKCRLIPITQEGFVGNHVQCQKCKVPFDSRRLYEYLRGNRKLIEEL